jgi:hypothetical protein
MKIIILSFLLLFFCNLSGQTFEYNDSTFEVGQSKIIGHYNFYTHPIHDKQNVMIIDSLATFLLENETIEIKITNHTCQRGTERYNLALSQGRAETFKKELISRGVTNSRIISVGIGESEPLIKEEVIIQMDTEEEREAAYLKNGRTSIELSKI